MILSKVYEDAEHRLERNEITLGEFERLVDIEVIEPKRGEWLPDENGDFRCTNCGRIAEWEFFEDNFCPNCGAIMKGADDD